MKTLTKFRFSLTRLVMLLLCLWALTPQATADVTIWVQANSAPHLFLKNGSGTCTGTASGTAYSSYTSSPGATMTNYVSTSDGKKWYYEVFNGLSSTTIAFNNGSTGNGNQTTDITSVSGTKYYYYGGHGYHIDLTSLKETLATNYCFFQNNSNFTTRYVYTFESETEGGWPGESFSTKVGYNTDGSYDIYYVPLNGTTAPGKIIFHNNSGNQSANLVFSKGNLYWYAQKGGGSFATITVGAWPEMPAAPGKTYTLYVYDPNGEPTVMVDGTAATLTTEQGTHVTWYKYAFSGATLPNGIVIRDHNNEVSSATITPVDGATDYYYYPKYGARIWTATDANYAGPTVIYMAGSYAGNGWELTPMDTNDGNEFVWTGTAFESNTINDNRFMFSSSTSWDDGYRPTTNGQLVIPGPTEDAATAMTTNHQPPRRR